MSTPTRWFGWFKGTASAPWKCLARADTLDACHQQLLVEIRRLGLRGHRMVTGSRSPDAILNAGRARYSHWRFRQ
jgi:hypothetical protein